MKSKFSSMGRVAIALVLALSLSLVMGAPVAANTTVPQGICFEKGMFSGGTADGVASWTEAVAGPITPPAGNYMAKLTYGETDDAAVTAAKVKYSGTLTALSTLAGADEQGMEFNYYYVDTGKNPYAALYLDTDADGVADLALLSKRLDPGVEDTWNVSHPPLNEPGGGWHIYGYAAGVLDGTTGQTIKDVPYDSSTYKTLAGWAALDTDPATTTFGDDADVLYVGYMLGGNGGTNHIAYVDDITIGSTTYPLEPIILDTDHPYFYTGGSTVTVTVPNFNANEDTVRPDTVTVDVISDSDGTGLTGEDDAVVLTETGPNTGVFVGSFPTTLDVPPGAGELVVADEDTITVTYNGEADWGAGTDSTAITATVDDTAPTIDDILDVGTPAEEVTTTPVIIFDSEPDIVAIVTDGGGSGINEASIVMKVNGDAVTTIYNDVAHTVTYSTSPVLAAGTIVEVTVDVDDNMGNSAEQASWSFTIADDFNVSLDTTEIPATTITAVIATFTDVEQWGPGVVGDPESLLATVTVTLTGPGVDLTEVDFDGTEITGDDATDFGLDSLTFDVTPEQAGTITVTFVGTFDEPEADPVTKTLEISVTGFLVEGLLDDVNLGTTDDISMTVTTEAGAKVNTGIVTITAPAAGGFEKNVDGVSGDESFQTIVINGSTGEITYDDADPEDFVVINGYYEVTGIKFAEVGTVDVLVQDAVPNDKAHFSIAFSIIGVGVYDVSLAPATVTAGVETEVVVTVTEDENPVTTIDSIKLDSTELLGTDTSEIGEYTITVSESEVGTPVVTVTGEVGQKYGTTDLAVALPTVFDYIIYETVGVEEVERNVMLVGADYDYTISVSVHDALDEPLDSGYVWLGTYDADEETFAALTGVTTVPVPIEDGLGEIAIIQDGEEDRLTAGTLVWKVGSGAEVDDAALILDPDQAITVEEFCYGLDPTEATVDVATTYTVTDNYGDAAADRDVKIVTPAIKTVEKTTGPAGTPLAGKFKYTATEVGDYYVSVKLVDTTWQAPITVTVSEGAVEYVTWSCPLDHEALISPYPGSGRPFLSVSADLSGVTTDAEWFQVLWLDESTGVYSYYFSEFTENTLIILEPGKFYYVIVPAACELTIPQAD